MLGCDWRHSAGLSHGLACQGMPATLTLQLAHLFTSHWAHLLLSPHPSTPPAAAAALAGAELLATAGRLTNMSSSAHVYLTQDISLAGTGQLTIFNSELYIRGGAGGSG